MTGKAGATVDESATVKRGLLPMAKDREDSNKNGYAASYREMLLLLETHYERTGDLALKEVVDRAKRNSSQR